MAQENVPPAPPQPQATPLFEELRLRREHDEEWHRTPSPPWIITFADMITLLLAFFVLLLSYSDLNVTRFQDVSGSLQESLGTQDAVQSVVPPPAQSQLAPGEGTAAAPLPEQLSKDLTILQKILSRDLVGRKLDLRVENDHLVLQLPPQRQGSGLVPQETIDMYGRIAEAQAEVESPIDVREGKEPAARANDTAQQFQQLRTLLAKEIAQGQAQVERDGERIVIRLVVQGSFYSGSANLSPDFSPVLLKIGSSIANLGGRVTIEGHTDSMPVSNNGRFRSNWDLSGSRAAAVADYLTDRGGVARERIAVRGLADTKPLASNETREGRAKNRRIEVLVDTAGL
jgi:chemotaxis protein MotB